MSPNHDVLFRSPRSAVHLFLRKGPAGLRLGILMAIGLQVSVVDAQQICGEWTQVDPPPVSATYLHQVTGLSANEAWALSGSLGTIHWDGTSWSEVPLPDLSGLGSSFDLDAMGSAGAAVFICGGINTGPFSSEQLLLIWDEGQWDSVETLELAPNPSGWPRGGAPRAIDGVSADDLWIVGTATSIEEFGPVLLTVHWDGSQLVEYITPAPGDRQNHLYGVAAVASDDVWAVGEFTSWTPPENGALHGMTFHWDGTSWSQVPNPTETMDSVHLHEIIAISSDDVWAAGRSPGGPLFMHWDGASWTIVPSPATNGGIYQLAAIASDDIWAVEHPGQLPLISSYQHWDGTAWSVVAAPEIPGATSVNRAPGLAAVGPCDVWAVGSIDFGAGATPFIERLQVGGGTTAAPILASRVSYVEVSPNPLVHSTQIRFAIPGKVPNRARIYDVKGSRVRTLFEEPMPGNAITWDGRDDAGNRVPGGVYFLRVEANGGDAFTEKLTVVR